MQTEEKRLMLLLGLEHLRKAVGIASDDVLVIMAREINLATERILEQV